MVHVIPPRLPLKPGKAADAAEVFASGAEEFAETVCAGLVFPPFDREHFAFTGVEFSSCRFSGGTLGQSQFADVLFRNCDLSNVRFSGCAFHRVRFVECKMVGADLSQGTFVHVLFEGCKAELANFAEGKFRHVLFDGSLLRSASLDNCRFEGVGFSACDLTEAEVHHTRLQGISLADSRIDGLRVGEVVCLPLSGVKVSRMQASELARLLGVEIEEF